MNDITGEVELPAYAATLSILARELTGHQLRIRPKYKGTLIPQLLPANGRTLYHPMTFHPFLDSHAIHLIMIALITLQRLWRLPVQESVMPRTLQQYLPETDRAGVMMDYSDANENEQRFVDAMLCDRIVHLVLSVPGAITIEEEIFERWPEHRPLQRAYLESIGKGTIFSHPLPLNPETRTPLLKALCEVVKTHLQESYAVAGLKVPTCAWAGSPLRVGRLLRSTLASASFLVTPDTRPNRIPDEWAEIVGTQNWYAWGLLK